MSWKAFYYYYYHFNNYFYYYCSAHFGHYFAECCHLHVNAPSCADPFIEQDPCFIHNRARLLLVQDLRHLCCCQYLGLFPAYAGLVLLPVCIRPASKSSIGSQCSMMSGITSSQRYRMCAREESLCHAGGAVLQPYGPAPGAIPAPPCP